MGLTDGGSKEQFVNKYICSLHRDGTTVECGIRHGRGIDMAPCTIVSSKSRTYDGSGLFTWYEIISYQNNSGDTLRRNLCWAEIQRCRGFEGSQCSHFYIISD